MLMMQSAQPHTFRSNIIFCCSYILKAARRRLYTMSSWLSDLVAGTELVEQTVYQPVSVFQKSGVCRITDICLTACGINLHCIPRGHCRLHRYFSSSACYLLPLPASVSAYWRNHGRAACGPERTIRARTYDNSSGVCCTPSWSFPKEDFPWNETETSPPK